MTNTDKAVELFKSNLGKMFHSSELNERLGWDFRKYVSNARKHFKDVEKEYELKTAPADKHFNFYFLIKTQNENLNQSQLF